MDHVLLGRREGIFAGEILGDLPRGGAICPGSCNRRRLACYDVIVYHIS